MLNITSRKVIFTGESTVEDKVICVYNAQIDLTNPKNILFSEIQKDFCLAVIAL